MTAQEWGTLDADSGDVGGDGQLGPAASRSFLTRSPAGFPVVVTVYAYAALVNPGDDPGDPTARRDLLEQLDVHTYLMGADPTDGDASPFDSETDYRWPVDWWPADALDAAGEPTLDALNLAAVAHVRTLPVAWLEGMPAPDYETHLES